MNQETPKATKFKTLQRALLRGIKWLKASYQRWRSTPTGESSRGYPQAGRVRFWIVYDDTGLPQYAYCPEDDAGLLSSFSRIFNINCAQAFQDQILELKLHKHLILCYPLPALGEEAPKLWLHAGFELEKFPQVNIQTLIREFHDHLASSDPQTLKITLSDASFQTAWSHRLQKLAGVSVGVGAVPCRLPGKGGALKC